MSITLDNAKNNDRFIHLLENWANQKEFFFKKEYGHFRCFAHIINLSVQEALSCLNEELIQVNFLFIKKSFL